jgi:hypothetical protein
LKIAKKSIARTGYLAMMTLRLVSRCAIGTQIFTWSSSAWPAGVLHGPGGGAVRALVMGVDKYSNLDKASELHGAVADAKDIAAALRTAGVTVQDPLVNEQVTRQRVIAEMDSLVRDSRPGDLVIISYSGHGMRVRGYKRWDGANPNAYHSQMALANFAPTEKYGHEVVVDAEMRAWYARLDRKGVDVLVVMDTCYGGHMRGYDVRAGTIKVRALSTEISDQIHDSFVPISMTEREAIADTNEMRHVTFFAGATEQSTVPEMPGIDSANRTAVRGALSYFMALALRGAASQDGKVTRAQLFKFLAANVRGATDGRQLIDFGPRAESDDVLQQVVFSVNDDKVPFQPVIGDDKSAGGEPVRVAIVNGTKDLFSTIERGRAPFIQSEPSEADVVWDVGERTALTRGDLLRSNVDASLLGAVIDRTWAVREIKKLASRRIIDVTMGENGRAYTLKEHPALVARGVGGSYLAVVNVASDGLLQLLFPDPKAVHQEQRMVEHQWTYSLEVTPPLGTDYTVVIATSGPADEMMKWLHNHNGKHDAFDLPAVLADTIKVDGKTRLGTAGLFTY